jgi:ketosteroid isomerase-like protein
MFKSAFQTFLFFSILMLAGCSTTTDAKLAIQQVMDQQAIAWNNKSLEGFMKPYWHSDSLRFMGKSGVTKGWQATLTRYQKNYTPEKMGSLHFSDLHFDILSQDAAWVDGQWSLSYPDTTVSGRFSLLWKFINGQWQIVADHSS